MSQETGPIYDVPLIKTLPIGDGGMLQAMPCRSERTVAGYEVLLAHYHKLVERVDQLEISLSISSAASASSAVKPEEQ